MAKHGPLLQDNLFPILPDSQNSKGKGIAQLAAQGSVLDNGHFVEYRSLKIRSILSDCSSKRVMFAKGLNPYRGCEFGCRYCYARYTHEFMEFRNPEDFEKLIFIKQNAAWMLRQDLRKIRPGEEIAIGTATDPYQPIERRAGITRSLLEVLSERSGLNIGIVTKSTLIERDIDLLTRIAGKNKLTLHLTITTADQQLARILEPRAPRPDLRFRTVHRLRSKDLRTGILCSPIFPGITDNFRAFDTMAYKSRQADASFFYAQPLFLKPCSRGIFLDFLRQHFPKLVPSYEQRFQEKAFVSKAYSQRIQSLVQTVCKAHGLNRHRWEAVANQNREVASSCQQPSQPWLWPELQEG